MVRLTNGIMALFDSNRNMFGGDNNNPVFPVYLEENRFQYDVNALPQLQLFGDCECLPKLIVTLGFFWTCVRMLRNF